MAEEPNDHVVEEQNKPLDSMTKPSEEDRGKAAAGPAQQAEVLRFVYDGSVHGTYSNLCRVTGTPEEVIMDFALNPNAFGQVVDEPMKIDHRIVMGYEAAKRTALVLLETVRRHEDRFGEIELDPRKRLRGFKTV